MSYWPEIPWNQMEPMARKSLKYHLLLLGAGYAVVIVGVLSRLFVGETFLGNEAVIAGWFVAIFGSLNMSAWPPASYKTHQYVAMGIITAIMLINAATKRLEYDCEVEYDGRGMMEFCKE